MFFHPYGILQFLKGTSTLRGSQIQACQPNVLIFSVEKLWMPFLKLWKLEAYPWIYHSIINFYKIYIKIQNFSPKTLHKTYIRKLRNPILYRRMHLHCFMRLTKKERLKVQNKKSLLLQTILSQNSRPNFRWIFFTFNFVNLFSLKYLISFKALL